ncbi:TetR/AcrR family transcriptional regulator [Nonomuraea rubra]|uniref:AcrR family transcriptional regulator n=1 Tax=Nonomuraea rubra TaxID=46180 RepID=A0A7X0U239_9ACTN|nr:TetR/AcrR family transcriptional regulator C-terminal domain-containing protein [Nonomuraea rubra]MBB6552392.1 AcrR family transcriptional regulator [Nonomuraea rubra]
MDNVWSRSQKSPRQTLTLERIVAEAVALLDEEGVGRLTMRRLAERLDTGSTTLYWHVKTKDDVLDLAMDEVFREVRLDDLAGPAGGVSVLGGDGADSAAPSDGGGVGRGAPGGGGVGRAAPGGGGVGGAPSERGMAGGVPRGGAAGEAALSGGGRGGTAGASGAGGAGAGAANEAMGADAPAVSGRDGGAGVVRGGGGDAGAAAVRGGGGDVGAGAVSRPGDWRGPVRGLMRRWRAALLRHPWSATLLDRPLMGPNALRRTEFLYETLTAAGFAAPKTAAFSLSNYVMGSVIMQVTWERSGGTDTGAFLRERADRYPALAEHGLEHDWDATFDEGLGYLLEGMAASRA